MSLVEKNGRLKIHIFIVRNKNPSANYHEILKKAIWMAPEHFDQCFKVENKPSDVFSLGLVFFYLLTNFSNPIEIESKFRFDQFHLKININLEQLDTNNLKKNTTESIFAANLIKKMIQKKAADRVTITDCFQHPYFWSNWKCMEFIKNLVSDISEFDLEDQINKFSKSIIGDDWSQSLDFISAPLHAAKNFTGCIYSVSKVYF